MRRWLITTILLCCVLSGWSRHHYVAVHNNFAGLAASPGVAIDGKLLAVDNSKSPTPRTLWHPTPLPHGSTYQFMARITGKQCGIITQATDARHYVLATVSTADTHPNDEIISRSITTVTISRVSGDSTTVLHSAQLKGSQGTVLGLRQQGSELTVLLGEDNLQPIATITLPGSDDNNGPHYAGCWVGAKSTATIERMVLTCPDEQEQLVNTGWNRTALDIRIANSRDPLEGYWTYLDRDLDDKTLRLGGRYTLALVRTASDGGYDIIYVDGAQVNAPRWQCGMLKGHLSPTIFTGNYTATWTDATFRSITDDVQAQTDGDMILTIRFPVYNNSQLRLSKVLSPD